MVPASPTPFKLRSATQHGGVTVWSKDTAPPHFLYLGDAATCIVFGLKAMQRHGGELVLLEVEVDDDALEPDPAYLVARQRLLMLGIDGFGETAEAGLEASGRVATKGPVNVVQRLMCNDRPSLAKALEDTRLLQHIEAWHDARTRPSVVNGLPMQSAKQWRDHVAGVMLPKLFVVY